MMKILASEQTSLLQLLRAVFSRNYARTKEKEMEASSYVCSPNLTPPYSTFHKPTHISSKSTLVGTGTGTGTKQKRPKVKVYLYSDVPYVWCLGAAQSILLSAPNKNYRQN
jgi:hypothetical protein